MEFKKIRWIFGYPDNLYNCSGRTSEEWLGTGEKWPIVGMLFAVSGAVFLILYIPSIYAIKKLQLTKNICYKIMLCLIFTDLANLVANSFVAGYLFSIGAVFCWNPTFMYLEGVYNTSIWGVASFLYVLLGVNRLLVIFGNPRLIDSFSCIPIYVWITLAIIWGFLCGVLGKPVCYNSRTMIATVFPYIEDPVKEAKLYVSWIHLINNSVFANLIFLIYSSIAIMMIYTRFKGKLKISKAELNALLQAAMITTPAIVGGYFYIFAQFTKTKGFWIGFIGQILWTIFTGMSSVIYLTMNDSVRGFYFGNRSRIHSHSQYEAEVSIKDKTMTTQL